MKKYLAGSLTQGIAVRTAIYAQQTIVFAGYTKGFAKKGKRFAG